MDSGPIEGQTLSYRAERRGDRLTLAFTGRLSVDTASTAWRDSLGALAEAATRHLTLDIAGLDYCDGAGAALLIRLEQDVERQGGSAELVGAAADIERLLGHYRRALPAPSTTRRRRHRGFPEQLGEATVGLAEDVRDLVAFIGDSTVAFVRALRHPSRVRWADTLEFAELTGFDALPIICMLGFLIGVILAFQSAIPLRAYGADLYVANLLGLSLLRELGPLLTAVILAGRSGSAFAAEIGTMKVKEELDALVTMGLDAMLFLVVPRTLAAVLMMPLLTIFLMLFGLAGGALVMSAFGIPTVTYINQLLGALRLRDLLGGLSKSLVFGVLVAGIGCYRGLSTGSGPSAVGASATSAVVSGIVLIIIADGIFAVVFYVLGL